MARLVQFLGFVVVSICLVGTLHAHCIEKIDEHLGKCKCNENDGEISCITQEAVPTSLNLEATFKELGVFLKQNNHNLTFPSLVIQNARDALTDTTFGDLKFEAIEIFEKNLTSLSPAVFNRMAATLTSLTIKSTKLNSFSSAIRELQKLESLYLLLGLKSLRVLEQDTINNMAMLDAILVDGVMTTIRTNAFHDLPLLERIKISNQVELIETGAFNLTGVTGSEVAIDLSNNRLTETSLRPGFITLDAASTATSVELVLSSNRITSLPENIFMAFLDSNSANTIVMKNNPFECGKCDSYWFINKFTASRVVGLSCANNPQVSPWKYDWKCGKNSANPLTVASSLLVLLLTVVHLFWV